MTEPDELAALLALDALDVDEQADAEMRFGAFVADLAPTTAALAEAVAATPPDDLRATTLAAALSKRSGGAPRAQTEPSDPHDALLATIDDLHALLGELASGESDVVVPGRFGRVHDVVSHLAAIEELVLGWAGVEPAPDPDAVIDHVAATRPVVDELANAPFADVVQRWYDTARRAAVACREADPELPVLAHDLPTTIDGLVLLRIFELWTHAIDIAAATGRPRPELDTPRLVLMSRSLVEALPLGIAFRGHDAPDATVRLVLTGPAGGAYDLSLTGRERDGSPAATTMVLDVVDLCLLATERLAPGDIDVAVHGDSSLVSLVLSGAGAFARD